MADKISDLSILGEGLRQLSFFQPWAQGSETEAENMKPVLEANMKKSMSSLAKLLAGMDNLSVAEEGNPSARFFYYPIDKRRSRQTVEDMQQAEN